MTIPKYLRIILYITTIIFALYILGSLNDWQRIISLSLLLICLAIKPDKTKFCGEFGCQNYIDEKEIYQKFNGRCGAHFDEHYHKIHTEKDTYNVKCRCDIYYCDKCLSGNCKDEDCPVHTQKLKKNWHTRDDL
ncbi:MAG: hypothetical protein WC264_02230 [Candidatus Paceibacterota bacterium]|jgi:hypothetical protein